MTCDEPMHTWFSLSYAHYLVVPRSIVQSMPVKWQQRMVELLEEMKETLDIDDAPSSYWVRARDGGRFVGDPYSQYRHRPPVPRRRRT